MKLNESAQGFTISGYRVSWDSGFATFHEFKITMPVSHKDFTYGWVLAMYEKLRKLKG